MSQRVFVAMSGGVDSAAAALLLRQAGYDVTGVTLRLHPYKDRPGLCGSADDIETARAVAAGMGIPHVVLDLCDLFRERVMDRFVWAYTHGRTPNPCIDCNREIKFGALLARILLTSACLKMISPEPLKSMIRIFCRLQFSPSAICSRIIRDIMYRLGTLPAIFSICRFPCCRMANLSYRDFLQTIRTAIVPCTNSPMWIT